MNNRSWVGVSAAGAILAAITARPREAQAVFDGALQQLREVTSDLELATGRLHDRVAILNWVNEQPWWRWWWLTLRGADYQRRQYERHAE